MQPPLGVADNKALVLQSFQAVIETLAYDEQVIRTYFAPTYRQLVDGQELDFASFCQHMQAQKAVLHQVTVAFNTVVQEGDVVFTNHVATLQTREGRTAVIKVLAEFKVQDGKIVSCDELTRLLTGDDRDRDLGSRQ